MATAKRLSNRRLALVEDLSAGDLAEQPLLDRHDIGREIYYRWLTDRKFAEDVNGASPQLIADRTQRSLGGGDTRATSKFGKPGNRPQSLPGHNHDETIDRLCRHCKRRRNNGTVLNRPQSRQPPLSRIGRRKEPRFLKNSRILLEFEPIILIFV